MTGPIFIVGVPRSGTTLMRSVLSAHHNITIAPETHFLDVFAPASGSAMGAAAFHEFWLRFTTESQWPEFDLDPALVEAAVHRSGRYDAASVFRVMLEEYARKMGKGRWGEKTPEHYRYIGRLLAWFPDARIIYMLRDPRAVCASLMTVPWRKQGHRGTRSLEPTSVRRSRRVYHDAVVWRDAYREFERSWLRDPRLHLVRYEDLVQRPETVVRDICAFVGEPYDAAMVSGRSWEVVPPPPRDAGTTLLRWRYQHVLRTLGEITTSSMTKWKRDLSAWEIAVIERICRDPMRSCGYELEHERRTDSVASRVGVAALAGFWAVRRGAAGSW